METRIAENHPLSAPFEGCAFFQPLINFRFLATIKGNYRRCNIAAHNSEQDGVFFDNGINAVSAFEAC